MLRCSVRALKKGLFRMHCVDWPKRQHEDPISRRTYAKILVT